MFCGGMVTSHVLCFILFRKIVCPVHERVLVAYNGLVTQIMAVLVRSWESHVAATAHADRWQTVSKSGEITLICAISLDSYDGSLTQIV